MNIIEHPTIVILEKRPIYAEAIRCMLESMFYDISIAKNKADVLSIIEKQINTIIVVLFWTEVQKYHLLYPLKKFAMFSLNILIKVNSI